MPSASPPSIKPEDLTVLTNNSTPTIPPPSIFSILPDIYNLISRLSILQQNQQGSTTTNVAAANNTIIEPKDLPTQIYPIKQKINKARAAVRALPDVQRSVSEQEREIRMLEARIEALRQRLGRFADVASRNDRRDVDMSGG